MLCCFGCGCEFFLFFLVSLGGILGSWEVFLLFFRLRGCEFLFELCGWDMVKRFLGLFVFCVSSEDVTKEKEGRIPQV